MSKFMSSELSFLAGGSMEASLQPLAKVSPPTSTSNECLRSCSQQQPPSSLVLLTVTACVLSGASILASGQTPAQQPALWVQSYDAGYVDANGAYAGGSEIMHLAAHRGKLFAANGYWMDGRWAIPPDGQKQSAQVLRLDSTDGGWEVDLDMGRTNEFGLEYMKGNILKSVTFTRDEHGKPLPEPRSLLVMAAGARFDRGGAVSAWVRNDDDGTWHHTLVRHGSAVGGVRWVPRDMQVYRDKVTGIERLFLLLGNPGVITAVYDPKLPSEIRWARNTEFPFLTRGAFRTRPLGMIQANGSLFFSVDDAIYRRIDGPRPAWDEVINLGDDIDTDVGGVRGLTAVPNPNGDGESLLFVWAPGGRSTSQVMRLDPDGKGGYTRHDEVAILDLMSKRVDVRVSYTLAAHNMMYPVKHAATGKTVHIIGFQGNIHGKDQLRWKGSALYGGAMYAIRHSDASYTLHEVNKAFRPGKTPLVSPRAFCLSPFGDSHLFIAGHDASNRISDDMAWVMKAPLDVVLGNRTGKEWTAPPRESPVEPRLKRGPVYELRTYIAAKDRFDHLVKRFREHTDRIFRKHNMEPVGYWTPTEGPPISKRTLVYILKHPSRYDAWKNWVAFTNDREWQRVLDQPVFKGLMIGAPDSVFMTSTDYSANVADAITISGGVFELRTGTANPGKLSALNDQFRDHTARLIKRHGMKNVGYWTPFDEPDSATQLIYLVQHSARQQAAANWKAFNSDPEWKKAVIASEQSGKLQDRPTDRLFLRPLKIVP